MTLKLEANGRISVFGHLSAMLIIALLSSALYLPYLNNAIIFDDHNLFINLSIFDYAQVPFSLSSRAFPYFTLGLTQVLFNSIEAHRIVSLVLHILVGWTLYLLLYSLLIEAYPKHGKGLQEAWQIWVGSLAAASAFSIHPIAVYGAGYLVQRTIVLATLFSLASLYLFHRCLVKQRLADATSAALLFGLAVFSKEHCVFLPAVGLLLIPLSCPNKGFAIRAAILYIALCVPSALLAIFNQKYTIGNAYEINADQILAQLDGLALTATPFGKWLVSSIIQMGLFFQYWVLWLLPDPGRISADLRIDIVAGWTLWGIIGKPLAYLSIAAFSALILFKGRSALTRLAGFAVAAFWLLFIVELGTVRFQEPFVLYRSYLWGPFILLLPALVLSRLRPWVTGFIAIALIAWLFPQAQNRLDSLRSELTVWEDAAAKLPHPDTLGADRIYYNRGGEYSNRGRLDEALQDMNKTVDLNPGSFHGYLGRGMVYLKRNDPAAAEKDLRQALRLRPNEGFILTRLALALNAQGKKEEGSVTLHQAAEAGDPLAQTLLKLSK